MDKTELGAAGVHPVTSNAAGSQEKVTIQEDNKRGEDWYTRNGLNLRSFQRRDEDSGTGTAELDRTMKGRHLHMIAIGGSIGAGFFVGSGGALGSGGPGSLLINFLIIGVMMFNVVYALGELSIMYPVSGGFYTYSARFIDPSWGFAMGWNYVFQWAIVLPLELTVCGITISYWNDSISVGVWITVFWLAILIINIFGTLGYAEEEFASSAFKLLATCIFLVIAFVLVLGGGPKDGRYNEYWGARLWVDPGPFQNGFRGFCSVFVTAAFAFSGTELVGLAAAEARNPVKEMPGAIKQVFWRITLFYILGLFFVGLLIDARDPNLLGSSSHDVHASPFVLVGKYAGLKGFDHFMNITILVSVLSIGVSAVYGGSRTLTALSQQGYAPKIFSYIDRSGRPLYSVGIILVFGLLAYVNLNAQGEVVFNWLLSLSSLAALFTWGSICLAHIRFRKAWAHNGHTTDEIPFKAIGGVWGSYLGLTLNILVLAAQIFAAIAPPPKAGEEPTFSDAEGFFSAMLALPIVILFWIIGYLWKREGWLKTEQIDVDSGRRELPWDEINAYRAELAAMPAWKRIVHTVFV
ncbi:Amino-acid permease inda1 [Pyricularia oryzae]|uniref:Amino-acid permease inda1 n=5 Tax=Pyricularia TaxID=48558 RepID=A0ABQ8NB74_PYRGI|nr:amino-acid permease inda1 [Pyricularia oryzae 70-15]ELQ37317.1 amino-acid permease inda1 [Pyricularia oryzae Y34]KAH8841178.1 Amino-acid permease inda1 [Pyricularia oryzae]KAI6294289.1 Amino-acid permease inda1 [Pyricularia grisea]EHA49222.1 amino-acid permease inda1 [Pyricularia oryzae 70-15]KAH9433497.1 Amino-acid permease inda1 [Pyricularia oryzae]